MLLQQYLKYLAPHRRKAKTISCTTGFGSGNRITYTSAMIMLRKPQRASCGVYLVRLTCHVITFRLLRL
ncbi:MAG: hypothetical protein ACJAY6_003350 [Yoonia sp.]|jgi:hypothetical protein